MKIPLSLERLIQEFSRLPGVGRKTAQRFAFSVLKYSDEEGSEFMNKVFIPQLEEDTP